MRFELAQTVYYIVAVLAMFFMIYRYHKNWFFVLILLLAFNGPISYFIPHGAQLLRVVTMLLATIVLLQTQALQYSRYMRLPIWLCCGLSV